MAADLPPSQIVADAPAQLAEDWPPKRDLFGVQVSVCDYTCVVETVLRHARRRTGGIIDLMPVHGLMSAARDADYRAMMNAFDIVAPDGQPVRWALNHFHKAKLIDRVYGPELMLRASAAAAEAGVPIFLYGSSPEVIERLQTKLPAEYPRLQIAGAESPPYRPLTAEEDADVTRRVNASGAGILFLGTGCPRQERFAHAHRHSIHAVQLCVGAAFDFHAGTKKMAPPILQRNGLEWAYRLWQEPRRLGGRYLATNSMFLAYVARRIVLRR